jgi:hypothetical protein
VLIGVVVLGMSGSKNSTPVDPSEDSVGYPPAGECMSADKSDAASREVVENTDWSNMAGSATWSAGTQPLVGGVAVFKEMLRIGTQACPDLSSFRPAKSEWLFRFVRLRKPTQVKHFVKLAVASAGDIQLFPPDF